MDAFRTTEGEEARIAAMYHVIEKGLTMPQRRMGFGQEMVASLIRTLKAYCLAASEKVNGFSGYSAYNHAVAVLREYAELHAEATELKPQLKQELDDFLSNQQGMASQQHYIGAEDFYKNLKADFAAFSESRHCVRNYSSQPVAAERVEAAISLANNAPSACNRQPCRVYCIDTPSIKQSILEIQGGNRGFGHLADKVLVVTADRRAFMPWEVFSLYVNGGIYIMNLSYALHFVEIAHCILTWVPTPENDIKARELLGLHEAEAIVGVFTIGNAPKDEGFHIATSPRKTVEETLIYI